MPRIANRTSHANSPRFPLRRTCPSDTQWEASRSIHHHQSHPRYSSMTERSDREGTSGLKRFCTRCLVELPLGASLHDCYRLMRKLSWHLGIVSCTLWPLQFILLLLPARYHDDAMMSTFPPDPLQVRLPARLTPSRARYPSWGAHALFRRWTFLVCYAHVLDKEQQVLPSLPCSCKFLIPSIRYADAHSFSLSGPFGCLNHYP